MSESEEQIPVTFWIKQSEEGESGAQQQLWQHYYRRLVGLARTKLREGGKRMADEEDVVASAFDAFFRGAEEGRFPQLDDRNDLWQILVMLTCRRAADQVKYQNRQRRGSGEVRGESVFQKPMPGGGTEPGAGFDELAGEEATPEFAMEVTENFRELLDLLGDETLEKVAIWKLEGLQNNEIAVKLGTTSRTVERKLALIRQHWADKI